MVAVDGSPHLSQGEPIINYGRRRRQQWRTGKAVEVGIATTRGWDRLGNLSLPFSPRDGTSKWNQIEHRLFSFISQNWRGKPLISHEVIINLIAATTSKTGLKVKSAPDSNTYPPGIEVSDQQMAELRLKKDPFHGDWNYSLLPRS